MSKIYRTKTGIELRLIEGGGQGDGIPRGFLSEADSAPELDSYEQVLQAIFRDSRIYASKSYTYGGKQFVVKFEIKMETAAWPKTSKKRHSMLQGLTIDSANYLYRFLNIGACHPTVDYQQRASKGIKTITYSYRVDAEQLEAIGVDTSDFCFYAVLKESGQDLRKVAA